MKRLFTLTLLVFMATLTLHATHNRAGEITYEHLGGLTYKATITTYTYAPSLADRCELELFWGDGTSTVIDRINGPAGNCTHMGEIVGVDIKRNIYVGTHTYPAAGSYTLYFEDPNRNAGVVNIPQSVTVPFYIETELIINPFLGSNNSPQLLNPPIDNACINVPFVHNPNAWDPDGDSLSFQLIPCKGEQGLDIPGFTLPAASNSFTLDSYSGDLLWDSPTMQGEVNFAMRITEYRNGVKVGSIIRDMQVNVVVCNNSPPVLNVPDDTCVEAGSLLTFTVSASDANGNLITLTATGGPLILSNSPAVFPQPAVGLSFVSSVFSWQTTCDHVRKTPYQMVFKATDNGQPVHLADLVSMNITVVAPAPDNLVATPSGNRIDLTWERTACLNAEGYRIYRREGPSGFVPGHCETGVPAYTGYKLVSESYDVNDTTFTDDNGGSGLIRGKDYCYMVVAWFADGAESYASNEACAFLNKDVPVITRVSVEDTGPQGSVHVEWSRPTTLDTIQIPGPYKYLVYHGEGFIPASMSLIDSLSGLNDTMYIHTGTDTETGPNAYRIDLYNDTPGNRFFVGSTEVASSPYLSIQPADNALELGWQAVVPWLNDSFVVYRQDPVALTFDSLTTVYVPTYTDTGLVNGTSYCYKVKSLGHYTVPGYILPIPNLSQERCEVPVDLEKPCPPDLQVTTDCIENQLRWTNPNNVCADDVESYQIWFRPGGESDFILLAIVGQAWDTTFTHSGLVSVAGCYAVTATDSTGNVSDFSILACVDLDSCSLYRIPNVFTPNADNYNDILIPFPFTGVEAARIQIFNRWGGLVYETEDPMINWNGRYLNTGNECPAGVYYYVCELTERYLEGMLTRAVSGTVTLLR